jgi:hypothetical protein
MDLGQIKMLGKGDKGELSPELEAMAPAQGTTPAAGLAWRRLATLLLTVVAVGLPINHVGAYALLVVVAVIVFNGEVSARPRSWLAAIAIVVIAGAAQFVLAPARVDEGHNVFLPRGPGDVLERGLPVDVYRHMQSTFDAVYPHSVRCQPDSLGCWQSLGFPDAVYSFSADSVWHKTDASRSVTALDFSNPVWLRLGFTNDLRYNWFTAPPDVHRADRDRRFWMGLNRWHLTMPWFEMLRLPPAYAGGELCWRGNVMWEGEGAAFIALPDTGCRIIAPVDAGRRVFGIAIKPDTLAMTLTPSWSVQLRQFAGIVLEVSAVLAGIMLVRFRARRTVVPFILVALSVIVIAIDDASFLGGVRPFDGGDDGLFYDSVGRVILQKLLAGDFYGALQGGENVFYYGGPGLRYFRALEHIIFGETYLGYLSVILLLPFFVYFLFRRFLPLNWSLGLAIIFVAVPVGTIFGTSFVDYAKWASRGFADPMAYSLFIAGIVPIIGSTSAGPSGRFAPAFFGALLLALAIFMKPLVAPAAAVLLGGTGIVCLYSRQIARLAGLCLGFSPVFCMALHNWVYGHVFVLFSSNFDNPLLLVMPPSAWTSAIKDVLNLNFAGGPLLRALRQIPNWLSGPAESYATAPLNAVAVAVLIYVVVRGRQFDPSLRLIGAAALAQHAVALFYIGNVARYHFLTWFLTALVVLVWFHQMGVSWLLRRYPVLSHRFAAHPWRRRLASGLAGLQKMTA